MEKRYTFKRSAGWWGSQIYSLLISLLLSYGGCIGLINVINALKRQVTFENIFLLLIIVLIFSLGILMLILTLIGSEDIRYIEVGKKRIKIIKRLETLTWDNIQSIKPVTKEELREHARYRIKHGTMAGFNMSNRSYQSDVIGPFTRISNNLDELALVTLADGKRYVINYPRELLTEEAIAQVVNKK